MCYVQWNITKIKEKEYLAEKEKKELKIFSSSRSHISMISPHMYDIPTRPNGKSQQANASRLKIYFQLIWETHTAVVDSVKYSPKHLEYYFLRIFFTYSENGLSRSAFRGVKLETVKPFFFRSCLSATNTQTRPNESENSRFHLFYKFCDYLSDLPFIIECADSKSE